MRYPNLYYQKLQINYYYFYQQNKNYINITNAINSGYIIYIHKFFYGNIIFFINIDINNLLKIIKLIYYAKIGLKYFLKEFYTF